jgi:flagellar motor protein MotB
VSGVGALDPVNNGKTQTDQAKNRRVIIVLIP